MTDETIFAWVKPDAASGGWIREYGANAQGEMNTPYIESTSKRCRAELLFDNCRKWLNLAERTVLDHSLQLDANRMQDFLEGIKETKAVLALAEGRRK